MTNQDRLDQLIEAVTVDCYNASEQATAFHAVFTEEVPLPTAASPVSYTHLTLPTIYSV